MLFRSTKDRTSKRQKTSKDSKGVSLACNPVQVEEPVVAHINSTSYFPKKQRTLGNGKDAFYYYGKRSGMLMT